MIVSIIIAFFLVVFDDYDEVSLYCNSRRLTLVLYNSFFARASRSWTLCQAARSQPSQQVDSTADVGQAPKPSLLSAHAGLRQSELDVYLQNFFCSIVGVHVEHPLQQLGFQKALFATPFVSR